MNILQENTAESTPSGAYSNYLLKQAITATCGTEGPCDTAMTLFSTLIISFLSSFSFILVLFRDPYLI